MFNFTQTLKSKGTVTFTAIVMTASVAATTFSTQAEAGKRERWIAGGIVAGVVGSAIVANHAPRNRYHSRSRLSRWERHVRRCERAYRSYDEASDTYIGYDGIERRCRK